MVGWKGWKGEEHKQVIPGWQNIKLHQNGRMLVILPQQGCPCTNACCLQPAGVMYELTVARGVGVWFVCIPLNPIAHIFHHLSSKITHTHAFSSQTQTKRERERGVQGCGERRI